MHKEIWRAFWRKSMAFAGLEGSSVKLNGFWPPHRVRWSWNLK